MPNSGTLYPLWPFSKSITPTSTTESSPLSGVPFHFLGGRWSRALGHVRAIQAPLPLPRAYNLSVLDLLLKLISILHITLELAGSSARRSSLHATTAKSGRLFLFLWLFLDLGGFAFRSLYQYSEFLPERFTFFFFFATPRHFAKEELPRIAYNNPSIHIHVDRRLKKPEEAWEPIMSVGLSMSLALMSSVMYPNSRIHGQVTETQKSWTWRRRDLSIFSWNYLRWTEEPPRLHRRVIEGTAESSNRVHHIGGKRRTSILIDGLSMSARILHRIDYLPCSRVR